MNAVPSFLAALLFATPVEVCAATPKAPDEPQATVNGNVKFAFALYKELSTVERGNLLIGPWSISCALVAARTGADGDTASEITEAAFLSPSPEGVGSGFGYVNQRLGYIQEEPSLTIRRATAIWCHPELRLRQDFTQSCMATLEAKVMDASFGSSAINEWVKQQTMGKIEEVMAPQDLSRFSRLVVVSALYFKGSWQRQFGPEFTRPGNFTLASGQTVVARMMHGEQSARYAIYSGTEVLELPYKGGGVVMLLFLPGDTARLDTLERDLSLNWFVGCWNSLAERKLDVALPSFTMKHGLKLNFALQRLGMLKAFTEDADFSGIDGSRTNLWIDSVFQKAFVDISEQGTEAAVAAGSHWMKRSAEKVEKFVCDRPFIFMIYAVKAGTILFIGRVSDPTQCAIAPAGS